MGRFNTSLELAKASWAVLKSDKELVVIPIISFFATAIVTVLMGGAIYLTLGHTTVAAGSTRGTIPVTPTGTSLSTTVIATPVTYVVGIIGYLAVTFVATFFMAALVAGAHQRLTGGSPTLGTAFGAASKRLPQIFLWSLVVGTVGLILQSIESRVGLLGQIVTRAVGAAWRIVTFLAIPVIIAEGPGPFVALQRSAGLFKRTWGENLIGQVGLGLVGGLAFLPGLLVALGFAMIQPVIGIIVGLIWLIVVSTIMAALSGIFRTALYLYAAGTPVSWFDEQLMAGAFRPRSGVV